MSSERIDKLLEQLKSIDIDLRQKAQDDLIALGTPAVLPPINMLDNKAVRFKLNYTSACFVLERIGDSRAI